MACCGVLRAFPAVSEKTAHLSKLLEAAKWRVMGYKGDDADGQPLVHPVRNHNCLLCTCMGIHPPQQPLHSRQQSTACLKVERVSILHL